MNQSNAYAKAYMDSMKKYMVCNRTTGEHVGTIVSYRGKADAYKKARVRHGNNIIITKVAAYSDTTRGQW